MYNNLKLGSNARSMEELCDQSQGFVLQKHQQFVKRWFQNGNKKILLFHGMGSGKTCTSIVAAEAALNRGVQRVYAVTPASLQSNYKKELESKCGDGIVDKTKVVVMSYLGFLKHAEDNPKNIEQSMVIIDEVQNVVSESGNTYKRMFNALVTKNPSNVRVVLLSGTPIFDRPVELALTMNLLNPPDSMNVKEFHKTYFKGGSLQNETDLMKKLYPFVSAFKGISPNAYAKRVDRVQLCPMSTFQSNVYKTSIGDKNLIEGNFDAFSQAFFSGPRMALSIVYPNGTFGSSGRKQVGDTNLLQGFRKDVAKLSSKFDKCLQNIERSDGPVFVYSNFVESGGVADFIIALQSKGLSEWSSKKTNNPPKSYGVFRSGKEKENKAMIDAYNSAENADGSVISVVVGSPAMKEGVSLKRCRQVHLLDPYWNISRTEQIIARAIRFCSHVDLPVSKRKVDVFHYAATSLKMKTVDAHIMKMSMKKGDMLKEITELLYKVAVDCPLFHTANGVQASDCYRLLNNIRPNRNNKNGSTDSSFVFKINASSGKVASSDDTKEDRLDELMSMQGIKGGNPTKHTVRLMVIIRKKTTDRVGSISFSKHEWLNQLTQSAYTSVQIVPSINAPEAIVTPVILKRATKKKGEKAEIIPIRKMAIGGGKVKLGVRGGAGIGSTQRVGRKGGCPKDKGIDEQTGKCESIRFPFTRTVKGKTCCYAKPDDDGRIRLDGSGRVYVGKRSATGLTITNLIQTARTHNINITGLKRKADIIKSLQRSVK